MEVTLGASDTMRSFSIDRMFFAGVLAGLFIGAESSREGRAAKNKAPELLGSGAVGCRVRGS
jgi:hypothetical protein